MNLDDKIAIVTCGAGGTGREIVRFLLLNGIQHVVIFDINLLKAKRTCDEFTSKYGKGRIIHLNVDITNEWEFETAFQKIKNVFKRVDILVNNPDVSLSKEIKKIINKNSINKIKCTEIGLKLLEPDGVLLNICKLSALCDLYSAPNSEASKDGLLAYTKAISHSGDNRFIRVLTLNPGCDVKDTALEKINEFINGEAIDQYLRNIQNNGTQKSDAVGRAAVYLIRYGGNGLTYSINKGKLRKLKLNEDENLAEEIEFG